MAGLMDQLMQQFGGDTLKQMSGLLGSDEQKTGNAVATALPMLVGELSRNASNDQGAQSLASALDKDHDGGVLDQMGGFLTNAPQGPGAGILRHVLGSREPNVERNLANSTGMDSGSIGKLLTMVAPIVMGTLGRTKKQNGLNASGLASMLGQERNNMEQKAPAQMGALNMLLDADGDGDVDLSDVAQKGMGLLGGMLGKG